MFSARFLRGFVVFANLPNTPRYLLVILLGNHGGLRKPPQLSAKLPQNCGETYGERRPFYVITRHRLNGYLAQRLPSLFLASSSRNCLNYAVLRWMFSWRARYPLHRCRTRARALPYDALACVARKPAVRDAQMRTYIHEHIYARVHRFQFMYICACFHFNTCMHAFQYMHACMHACIHFNTCMQVYISAHACAPRAHARMHASVAGAQHIYQ